MENWLTKQAQLEPQKIALLFEGKSWTFKQLRTAVVKFAGCLTTAGFQNERRIALIAANTAESYFALLALQQLGIEPVLLNFRLSLQELKSQLATADIHVILVDPKLSPRISGIAELQSRWTVSSLQQLAKLSPVTPTLVKEFAEEATASIMYTSGTTGAPHGVMQSYRNHFYSAVGSAFNLGLQAHDLWLCAVPLFHISGLSIVMRSLIYGMGVLLVRHFEPVQITKLLCTAPVTLMSVVPQMLVQLLAVFPVEGYQQDFRGFLLGGAPISHATLALCQERKLPVVQSYGMTETCSQIVALNFADAPDKIGSVGKPLFPVQLRITGKGTGEVQVKAPNVVKGYLNAPDDFKKKLTRDGWFRTGDLGVLDAAGFLFIKGRIDEMFISGGENIYPNEIEAVYAQFPAIQEIAVIGVADQRWGAVPCAFYVADTQIKQEQLRSYGRQKLAHYKVPRYFIRLAQLPRTASGKVQHYLLQQFFSQKRKSN
ncbi:o-succinylbenzoate--CoA ligase [Liquorilactobacillus satsumensis]|uniref:o-succinylbenzoate--CoA ligase n=1 Tax=Liquorilactobacillus satsumensis TaxID=259059 RepID=UPI0021C2F1A1|nr:o-succinylbenzoate--CoA ligase [Liquorilactobacillus satsumensis]MCP9312998.1 o-succinylbenzoate--CoA ligase [Liquorilactobacillus satsumensis]MCP9360154.1 o-succinylbenzoate--CoA ligase [Liquorilactobacillus satsumensis]